MLIDFRHLFPKYDITPRGVLHVGANVGEEAPVYHELGIKKVSWVEANPNLIAQLSANVTKFNHWIHPIAAGEETKKITLHISNNAGQSSSVLELGTHKISHPEVHYVEDIEADMWRLDEYFSGGALDGYDFLNLDIQGYELHALRGMGDLLKQFRWVYTEVNRNEVYKGCATLVDMDLFMTANGFRRVELFNNGGFFDRLNWSDALYIK